MRIAFFSALKEERAAIRQAWPMLDSGTLKGIPFDSGERAVGFCSGMGAERMATAVARGLQVFEPALAVLVGYSAGLRDDLSIGEVICDERGDQQLVQELREFPIPLRFGKVAGSGYLHSAEDKKALAAARPECLVADLETEAFIEAVGETPFLILRAVSDGLETNLPLPFDQLVTARGFPDEMAIFKRMARKPKLVPKILSLAQAAAFAQRGLRETVADIRPLLVRRLLEKR